MLKKLTSCLTAAILFVCTAYATVGDPNVFSIDQTTAGTYTNNVVISAVWSGESPDMCKFELYHKRNGEYHLIDSIYDTDDNGETTMEILLTHGEYKIICLWKTGDMIPPGIEALDSTGSSFTVGAL